MNSVLFSEDRLYRYRLEVVWDSGKPRVVFIAQNPSKADEERPDLTVSKCVHYAKWLGAGALLMLNLFAFVSTDPAGLNVLDPIGPLNTLEFLKEQCEGSLYTIAGWGDYRKHVSKKFWYRANDVAEAVPNLHCLRLTKDGIPSHPSRLPYDLTPIPYKVA